MDFFYNLSDKNKKIKKIKTYYIYLKASHIKSIYEPLQRTKYTGTF